ncbi:hypothetical protein BU17DRAFT_90756 [Hysterangium stoloniferum]|nr:hypothetical protein BU17DRAFT_90756 [Hysterangium stoloniferum]
MSENWLFELHQKLGNKSHCEPHSSTSHIPHAARKPTRRKTFYQLNWTFSTRLFLSSHPPVTTITSSPKTLNPDVDMKDVSVSDVSDAHVDVEDDSFSFDDFNHDDLFELLRTRVRYIDITPLNLTSLPPVHFPLLIRDERVHAEAALSPANQAVASERLPTSFSFSSTVFYVANVPFFRAHRALFTKYRTLSEPSFPDVQIGARIVVISSLKDRKARSWMKHLPGGNVATAYMMNPFTFREYLLAGIFLHSQDLTYARLHAARTCLGINPRRCFLASTSSACLKDEVASVKDVIAAAPSSFPSSTTPAAVANFHITCLNYTAAIIGSSTRPYQRNHLGAAVSQVLPIPSVFPLLQPTFPRRPIIWDYPGGTEYKAIESASFSTELEAQIRRKTSTYFQPLSASYPTLDSLVYRSDRLDFLQMTVAENDPRKIAGFQRIQRALKLKGPASNLRPSTEQPWMFIFIVPEETAPSFTKQPFGGVWDSKTAPPLAVASLDAEGQSYRFTVLSLFV